MPMHFSLQMGETEMFVSMLMLLTALSLAASALTDMTLITDQLHTVLCVWTVAQRYFPPGKPLVLSMPQTTPDVARRALSDLLPLSDELWMVNGILRMLNEGTRWPIELFRPNGDESADTSVLHHSYILFMWNEEARNLNETLENQLDNLKNRRSWNPRGSFLVVATDNSNVPAHLLAAHICSILWKVASIVNVVVLIPNQLPYRPLHAASTTKAPAADRQNLYTWFPFKLGKCGEFQDVILVDEWVFESNVTFTHNADLYPAKVPKNFMGCPIKVGAIGIIPYVIMTENFTQNDGSTAYKLTGLTVEIFKFVCENLNLTYIFLPPSLNIELESYLKVLTEIEESISEVLIGIIPLMPAVVMSYFDFTIPYFPCSLKTIVPCPNPIPGTEKLFTTFSLSLWLTIGLVLLATTAVFWCASNGPYRSVRNETQTYRSLSNCFQNVWAIFLAVSVPQQPKNFNLKFLFLLNVCFSFAISTVFQAFFVYYLVEPEYEKRIESLDELLHSDLVYGHYSALQHFLTTVSHPEFVTFFERKERKIECVDTHKCIERMITMKDMAFNGDPLLVTYIARELGKVDVGKLFCPFDETLILMYETIVFKKGNPILDRFNFLMRLYLEAGLMEKFWEKLQHVTSLRAEGRFRKGTGGMFFAFSFSHLKPAFVVLLVGTVVSSVVFIGELIVNCIWKRRGNNRIHAVGE